MFEKMQHATVTLPKPEVHAKHPFRNETSHTKLLEYVQSRLIKGKESRDQRLGRMIRVDKSIAGWKKMTDDDKKRAIKEGKDGIPQALTMNLPLTYVQIDDMMTYFAQTFAPNRGMFYQTGKPDEVSAASQIVTLMNNHAIYAGYYRHMLLTTYATLKYNLGGFFCEWAKDFGPKLTTDNQSRPTVQLDQVIWQGNRVESLDMYNTFWDPSVDPINLHRLGEWCARTKIVSHYSLQSNASRGLYFNVEEALESDSGIGTSMTYYRSPPVETRLGNKSGTDGDIDWVSWMAETPDYAQNEGFEVTEIYIKLNPVQMNLIPGVRLNAPRNRYEIWRITLLNDEWIIDTTPMLNMHGFLPMFFGTLNDDGMTTASRSVAEILKPLQDFASFLLNTHVQATRKNIWGLTVYDKSVVDLAQIPEGEVNATVAALPTAAGKNIRDAIYQHQQTLDTKQTMNDLEAVMGIINQFFPTTSLPSQIASIDRAVDSQVAAVQQGANRRMQKGARLLDETLFRPLRFALYYNIVQFQPDNEQVNDFYGKTITINLSQLKATDLPFVIGQGLKAIDRQAAAGQLQNIIFAMIQNPATAQRVDLMKMIDYWTSMLDIDMDMTQFQLQPEAAPGMGHNGAPPGPLPGDEGVVPATDPAAMTEPLRG